MTKLYLIKAGDEMRIVDVSVVKQVYDEEFLPIYGKEDIEVCHMQDEEAFEIYEISDEEYVKLDIEPRKDRIMKDENKHLSMGYEATLGTSVKPMTSESPDPRIVKESDTGTVIVELEYEGKVYRGRLYQVEEG